MAAGEAIIRDNALTLWRRGTYAEQMVRWRHALTVGLVCLLAFSPSARAQAPVTPLLRLFLSDGTSLTSFGEWVRMGDRVVFSLPLGEGPSPDLQLVTIAATRVDWPRTERYAATARTVHYAATRAEDDYAQFSNQVAAVLTGIAREPDPKRRLAMAGAARAAMADWPNQHHGYRAADVRQMLTLLDEVISDLRASAGEDTFELGLVSTGPPAAAETLLPPPTAAQLADELLTASALVETSTERTTLLESVIGLIDRAASLLPAAWATRVRSSALGSLTSEHAADAAYTKLAATTLDAAAKRARSADVRGIERLRAHVLEADAKLGSKRPAELSAVLSALDVTAESARRLRLARDQWQVLQPEFNSYRRAVGPALRELQRAERPLEDIRAQAGPKPRVLALVTKRFYRARPAMAGTNPPPMLASVHALLQSAWNLADNALKLRQRAIESGDATRATEASAAAAGALMLAARAREDLDKALAPPSLQ